ncbi:hypothetical protein GCM10025789_28000 [Tessaracoccus lubricantis]|uniref:Uncharacterized protein n=1 Tax=Tessaracoccus lubricantis TaxID=545543 RepID=A0ABP9FSM0_9ACTN
MTERKLPNLDIVDEDFLAQATTNQGPWVTILLPTQRTGRETLAARSQYQNLVKLAESELQRRGGAEEVLAALHRLVEDRTFWLSQSDGLAVYAAPGLLRTFRLPMSLPEEACVADHPRLAPLAGALSAVGGSFDLLALAANSVRLFEGTRNSIGELAFRDDTPTGVDEVPTHGHETQLQSSAQSRGGDFANFHGHGGDRDVAAAELERLFRGVAIGVDDVLGRGADRPLVLAGVAEHGATFRAISTRKNIVDDMVTGNVEHLSAEELHERAWPIAEQALRKDDAALTDRYNELVGTGKASDDVAYIARAAEEGRVDTLLLRRPTTAPDGQPRLVTDEVDAVIVHTLRNSGALAVTADEAAPAVRAIFRY